MPGKIIAACGNDCSVCPRYVAPPYEKTTAELEHTAELWYRIGYRDRVVSAEEIACTGCKPENRCRYAIVKCVWEKGISDCGKCPDYPCETITECFEKTMSFAPGCKAACTDEEYIMLSKAFFEKRKNLENNGK